MIDDLADVKIQHWDRSLRELTAKALAALTECDPTYMHDVILPKMVDLFIPLLTHRRSLNQRTQI